MKVGHTLIRKKLGVRWLRNLMICSLGALNRFYEKQCINNVVSIYNFYQRGHYRAASRNYSNDRADKTTVYWLCCTEFSIVGIVESVLCSHLQFVMLRQLKPLKGLVKSR